MMNRKVQQYIEKYEALGYGEDHLLFACHAAFPTGVTVHLLYQMWANFSTIPGRSQSMNPIVISDFLLSNLVRETSLGIFEMHARVRAELLQQLKADERFGEKSIEALAFFLYQYIQRSVQERDYDTFRETQYWTAMAVIAPHRAAKEIGKLLGDKIQAEDTGEILRLNRLLEQIGQEEKSFEHILNYSRGLRDGLLERPTAATESFNKVMVIGEPDPNDPLSLKIPLMKSVLSDQVQFRKAPSFAQRKAQELAEDLIQKAIAEERTFLRLSNIPFLEKIPDSIRAATQLEQLYVESSSLKVFPDLRMLPNLEMVHLTDNELERVSVSQLPPNLLLLSLNNNALHQLDGGLWSHSTMQALLLKNNALKIMPAGFLQAGETLSEVDLSENPWLNLPQPAEYPSALEAASEHWLSIPTGQPCIQLFGLGYQLGETLLDIRDRLGPWEAAEQIAVQNKLILHRFGLYNYAPSTDVGVQISYFGGANFELITTFDRSEIVESTRPEDFAILLANRSSFTNLVILNVPNSTAYAEALLAVGFQAVIAAPGDLNDTQLFTFQEGFFGAMQEGLSIRAAFDRVLEEQSDFGGFEQMSATSNIQQTGSNIGSEPGSLNRPWEIYEAADAKVNWEWRLPEWRGEAGQQTYTKGDLLALMAKDDLIQVFDLLKRGLDQTNRLDDILMIQGRFNNLQEQQRRGLIAQRDYERQTNQIRQALISLLDELESDGNLPLSVSAAEEVGTAPEDRLQAWQEEQMTLLKSQELGSALDVLEPQIRMGTASYHDLVIISNQQAYLQELMRKSTISTEEQEEQRNALRQYSVNFIRNVRAEDLRDSSSVKGPKENIIIFRHNLYAYLRKNQWANLWAEMDRQLKPTAVNFERFFLEWKYQRTEAQWSAGTIALEDNFRFRSVNVEALCSFIKGLRRQELKSTSSELGVESALDYFEYSVLRLLPKGDIQNILYFINDKLVPTRGLNNQFTEWEGRLMDLENNWSRNTIALEDYFKEYEKVIWQWGDFLQNEMSESLLRSDYLDFEKQNLRDRIQRLQSQKVLDFIALNRLEQELRVLENLTNGAQLIDWAAVVACYRPIAENRLAEALRGLLEITNEHGHRLSTQLADLRERLALLEKDRAAIPYSEYRKERSNLLEGVIVTMNDLLADAEVPEAMWRPELADYIRHQVDQRVKEGQLKEVFTYLRKILYPAGTAIRNVLELSASYYELEAAQYQEEREYYSIMEELNQFERYLYELLAGEYRLRADFLDFERNRLEEAMKKLQSIGKSKKFDIRRDGDYQQLEQDLMLLNKL
jgi:hypothetical protein